MYLSRVAPLKFIDWYFIFVLIILPTSFFAFVNQNYFYKPGYYDLAFIDFVLAMPFFLFIKKIPQLLSFKPTKLLIIVGLYVCIIILKSYLINDIGIKEVITISRVNFLFVFQCIAFLLFFLSITYERFSIIVEIVIFLTILQGALFVFANIFNINLYSASYKPNQIYNQRQLISNLFAVPPYLIPIYFYLFISLLLRVEVKYSNIFSIAILLFTQLLTFVRSGTVIVFIGSLLVGVLVGIKQRGEKLSKAIKVMFILLLTVTFYIILFPDHYNKYREKWGISTFNSNHEVDYSTYNFRKELNVEANQRIQDKHKWIMGLGYKRAETHGKYDFVLGTDTLIAPVIFCEGYLGLIIRVLPLFFLGIYLFREYIRSKKKESLVTPILGLVLIITESINWVQTKIFTHYQINFLFILMILYLGYDKKITEKSEESEESEESCVRMF